ncbi:MAG: GGDEF domain-containing protein [Clostridia bacterium]|nr:GGDEF domain-containing protein [Clostridia bacterium]
MASFIRNLKEKSTPFWDKLKENFTREETRMHTQFVMVYAILSAVSLVMTVVNLFTDFDQLMYVTLSFFVINLLNIVLAYSGRTAEKISRILFCLSVLVMFTYFLVSGSPEGFSAIWVALLPVGGMLLFRRKYGSVLCLIQFLILVALFWTEPGRSLLLYPYNRVFLMRFPILYVAFFAVGFCFESIRIFTQSELSASKEKYRSLSVTDALTGLGNETLYYKFLEDMENHTVFAVNYAVAVIDVNGVKVTNDTYGHRYGCHLIVTLGKMLPEVFPSSSCFHVGGDEFVIIVQGEDFTNLSSCLTSFKERFSYTVTTFEGQNLTLSAAVGCSIHRPGETYSATFQRADKDMYENKRSLKSLYGIPSR